MKNDISIAIIKTLSYFDIFDYPLTLGQIYKFIHSKKKVSKELINKHLDKMSDVIKKRGKYCFFDGRRDIVEKRISKEVESKKKLKYAKSALRLLCFIPSVKFLGVSGSLSMNNSREEDDVDIFVITDKNALWITRFFVTMILLIFKKKRKREGLFVKDKICPNMFISINHLKLGGRGRSLFLAHEIVQLSVIKNKDNTFEQFLYANKWIKKLLPNAVNFDSIEQSIKIDYKNYSLVQLAFVELIDVLDSLAYILQFRYMRSSITKEKIGKNIAKFHPIDRKNIILRKYRRRCKYYLSQLLGSREVRDGKWELSKEVGMKSVYYYT